VECRLDQDRVVRPKRYSTGQSWPSSEQIRVYFSLHPWRLGAKNLVEFVLFICGSRDSPVVGRLVGATGFEPVTTRTPSEDYVTFLRGCVNCVCKPPKKGITESEEDASRKDAKLAKFGEKRNNFSLHPWRLGAKILVEVVLFICGFRGSVAISAALISVKRKV
jgi:hypothetical protein